MSCSMNPKSYVGCASMYDCADFFTFVSSFFLKSVSASISSVDVVVAAPALLFACFVAETPLAAKEEEL